MYINLDRISPFVMKYLQVLSVTEHTWNYSIKLRFRIFVYMLRQADLSCDFFYVLI